MDPHHLDYLHLWHFATSVLGHNYGKKDEEMYEYFGTASGRLSQIIRTTSATREKNRR
jgi:hypothetical protein